MKKQAILLFSFLLLWGNLQAQDYSITRKHLSIKDGLSSRYCNHIYQDSKGFIWIATAKGVNKWDGYKMKVYFERVPVGGILEDSSGTIWLQYKEEHSDFEGLASTVPIHIGQINAEAPLMANEWRVLAKLRQGILLWSQKERMAYLYAGQLIACPHLNTFLRKEPFRIAVKNSDRFWLIREYEIILLDKNGIVYDRSELKAPISAVNVNDKNELFFYRFSLSSDVINFPRTDTIAIFKKTANCAIEFFSYLYPTSHDALQLNAMSGQFFIRKNNNGLVWKKFEHSLTASSSDGNIIFDHYRHPTQNGGQILIHAFFDIDENLWVATHNGVYQYTISIYPFHTILKDSFPAFSTRGILKYNDTLLVNSYRGTYLLDLHKPNKAKLLNGLSIQDIFIHTYQDNDSIVFLGGSRPSILRYNKNTRQSHRINHRFGGLIKNRLQVPYRVKNTQELWIGGTHGLCLVNEETSDIETLVLSGNDTLPANIRHFYENEKGLWIAARNGLYLVDASAKKIIRYYNKEKGDLPYNSLNYIYEDKDGYFWIATQGYGLLLWNPRTQVYQLFGRGVGFLNLNVHTVFEDNSQRLWCPTDYGLVVFDKHSHNTRIFLKQDGITDDEFNGLSFYKDENGYFYFGGINGINIFHPDSVLHSFSQTEAHIRITSLTTANTEKAGQSIEWVDVIDSGDPLTLQPSNTSFSIEFAYLDFYSLPNISYAYKLEGLDRNWNYQSHNSIRFASLPAGDFTLLIKAKGNDGIWTKNILKLPIRVLQPFYKTKEFFLFLAASIALFVYGYAQYRTFRLKQNTKKLEREVALRTQKIEEQKLRLEKLNQTKARLYALIAHDIRGPAHAFYGMARKINYLLEKKDMEQVLKFAAYIENSSENLNKLLDNLLQWAQQQEGDLAFHPETHDLQKLVYEVFSIFDIVAKTKNLSLHYDGDPQLSIYGDYQMLTTILRNVIDNAIKFSYPRGAIWLMTRIRHKAGKDWLSIVIKDKGIGMTSKQVNSLFSNENRNTTTGTLNEKGTGLGMLLVNDFLKMHDATIHVESILGQGVKVEMLFPLKKDSKHSQCVGQNDFIPSDSETNDG